MARFVLAMVAVSLTVMISWAAEPPKPMPGKVEPAKAGTTGTIVPGPAIEEACTADGCCDSSGSCGKRPGILARISARWCGHHCAKIDPIPCTNQFPSYGSYCPVITSYTSGCVKSDCGRKFGFGRFSPRGMTSDCGTVECKSECQDSAALRLRAWLGLRRCRNEAQRKCMPTPYHSPVRYYFQPDGEPVANGEGCTLISPGGRIPGLGGCLNTADCSERDAAIGTLRGLLKGIGSRDGLGCSDGHCRRKEECYGIPGSHFNNDVRFARDEKMKFAPIVASEGAGYRGGWHFDLQRVNAETVPQVISAGYKATAK